MKFVDILPVLKITIDKLRQLAHIFNFQNINTKLTIVNASDTFYQNDLEFIFTFCNNFWNNFGQTESGPRIFACNISKVEYEKNKDHFIYKGIVSIGKPVSKQINVILKHDDFENIQIMYYKTPFLMNGYIDSSGVIIRNMDYICSNDIFVQNSIGMFFVLGRKKNIINHNGMLFNLGVIQSHFINKFDFIQFCKAEFVDEMMQLSIKLIIEDLSNLNEFKKEIKNEDNQRFMSYPRLLNINFIKNFDYTDTGKIQNFNIDIEVKAII